MRSKKKLHRPNTREVDFWIAIERDMPMPPRTKADGLYRIRVFLCGREITQPFTGFPDFDKAIRRAWTIKDVFEKRWTRSLPAKSIKLLQGVEELIDIDPTLKFYIQNQDFSCCKTQIFIDRE